MEVTGKVLEIMQCLSALFICLHCVNQTTTMDKDLHVKLGTWGQDSLFDFNRDVQAESVPGHASWPDLTLVAAIQTCLNF